MADLVLINGKVITVDDARPKAEAIAVKGDRIAAVGTNGEIKRFIGKSTQTIDLHGMLAIPGFIEGHAHFVGLGEFKMNLNLTPARNWDEIVRMVADAAKEAESSQWILGRGWHQEKWDRKPDPNIDGLPIDRDLNRAAPNNPVFLTHASGHMSIANARALELANISRDTPDPDGGKNFRDKDGNPTGVLLETAHELMQKAFAESRSKHSASDKKRHKLRAIDLATRECLSNGITSLHDAGTSFDTIDLYRKLANDDKLDVRIYAMIDEDNAALKSHIADYRMFGAGHDYLTVRAIKRVMDGALGSHGAWLIESYDDLPSSVGINTTPMEVMEETARIAVENDFQLSTHAIGDRANREALNLYEDALRTSSSKGDPRWRIEHAQILNPNDIPRFARLGVIASMQGIHCTSDAPWVHKRIGARRARAGAYAWRSLLKSGATIANGTDAPVESVDPIQSFYALVTRRANGGHAFYSEQRMTRDEALRAYTINGAYAAFQEKILGSISPGKLADIAVLSKDIMTVPEDEILATQVVYTIVGGKVKFQAQ